MKTLLAAGLVTITLAACAAPPEAVATDVAPLRTSCEATSVRAAPVEVVVTPDDGDARVVGLIVAATTSIDVTIYQLSSRRIVAALEDAARRGVAVRVLQEPDETIAGIADELRAAGVQHRPSPDAFRLTHQKTMTFDHHLTFVFSGNFDRHGFAGGRNYGILDQDPDDVADFDELFTADWTGRAPSIACTRLVVSPVNARARVLDLIDAASATLDVETMYITDRAVEAAVVAAHDRHVAVRVLFNDPAHGIGDATPSARRLTARGIEVRRSGPMFVHAKLIVADGASAFVGSENFSPSSLDQNREAGLVVSSADADVSRITAAFQSDWKAAAIFAP